MTEPVSIGEVRRRFYNDYRFYASNALKIRTKANGIVPFVLNAAQERLLEVVERQIRTTGRVRVVILKGRQMGLSTCVGGWLYHRVSQNHGKKAIVVTHHADSTRALFDMTKRFHDMCPEVLRPSTRYASRRELSFNVLDSSFMVGTAGGDGIARGETITHAHLSELAFWPKSSALANFNGLMEAIPSADGTAIFIESTANGVSGLFYDLWRGAVADENGFEAVFLPWFIDETYREPVPNDFERTPREEELATLYGLDDGQLMFRRLKVAKVGEDLFKQEYPCCAEEAFLTSGRPVFNPAQLARMVERGRSMFPKSPGAAGWEPLERRALEGETWQPHPRGELLVYREYDPAESYFIGADVGAGVQRDWSVAQVLDSSRRQAAVYRAQADPDYFATILRCLGRFYGNAFICVERNNHGILTCTRLGKDFAYPNFYTETVYDKLTDRETTTLGFNTNAASKPLIIDKLRADLRDNAVELNDSETLAEMQAFVVTDSGRMEAEKGCHDDTVMALALANHINSGPWTPIANQPGWYVQQDD